MLEAPEKNAGYGLFTGHVQAYFTKDSTDVLQGEGSCSVRQQGFYHIVYEDQVIPIILCCACACIRLPHAQ